MRLPPLPAQQAFFLPTGVAPGGRFCVYHPPALAQPQAAVVHVHAFAEEMNKSRRMVAQQARQFAAAGVAVLQIDLLGCGDSAGDFGDATWPAWLADVHAACDWLAGQVPAVPLWLWGLRTGCLLATAAAAEFARPANLLLWQPPASGKLMAQQFLRLRLAADMMDGQGKGAMEAVRRELAAKGRVDIAGYTLSAALLQALEAASLVAPQQLGTQVHWLEVSTRPAPEASLLPASQRVVQAWQAQAVPVQAQVLPGPAFWQTTEIEDAPALWAASTAAVLGQVVAA